MKWANTEERHFVKSLINAYRKEFPTAFRRQRITKKQKKEIKKFQDFVQENLDHLRSTFSID